MFTGECRHKCLSGYLYVEIHLSFRLSAIRAHFLHEKLFLLERASKYIS